MLATIGPVQASADHFTDAWRMAEADGGSRAAGRQRRANLRLTGGYRQLDLSPALEVAALASRR